MGGISSLACWLGLAATASCGVAGSPHDTLDRNEAGQQKPIIIAQRCSSVQKTIRILTPAAVFETAGGGHELTVLPAMAQVKAVCAEGKWLKIEAQAGDRRISGYVETTNTNWQP